MTGHPRRALIDDAAAVWSVPTGGLAERLPNSPLVIIMHGCGSDENELSSLAPLLPEGVVTASLRAPFPYALGGFAWFAIGGNPTMSEVDDAADAVIDWLDRVEAQHGTPTAIVGLGFSQGGAMAIHLLRTAPERFTAAVNLSGFVTAGHARGDRVLAERPLPVFWGRDVGDPVIPDEAIERTQEWLPTHSQLTAKLYPGIQHAASHDEFADVAEFLREHASGQGAHRSSPALTASSTAEC